MNMKFRILGYAVRRSKINLEIFGPTEYWKLTLISSYGEIFTLHFLCHYSFIAYTSNMHVNGLGVVRKKSESATFFPLNPQIFSRRRVCDEFICLPPLFTDAHITSNWMLRPSDWSEDSLVFSIILYVSYSYPTCLCGNYFSRILRIQFDEYHVQIP